MKPGRSRGPWEWECRQQGGAACESEKVPAYLRG